MWKLGWFLRDFLYHPELLAHEQVDEPRHEPVVLRKVDHAAQNPEVLDVAGMNRKNKVGA